MDEQDKKLPSGEEFLMEEPLLEEETAGPMPELLLDVQMEEEISQEEALEPVILCPEQPEEAVAEMQAVELPEQEEALVEEEPATAAIEYEQFQQEDTSEWDAPEDLAAPIFAGVPRPAPAKNTDGPTASYHGPRKGRPKRKKGYGLFGIPHLLATVVWLAIIVMIGTSLGRMLWVCAADVLAFGRESKQVTVTITSKDTIEDIAEKLHEAELVRYPGLFELYASIAVDDGDILPGTFQLDTLYDYHALVVQMGPRSSTREVVDDLLIPEGLNCRQIFELLEQKNVCTVEELEEFLESPDSVESRMELKELTGAIESFLDSLNELNRVIFVRRYWFYDNYMQIAKKVGLSEKNVSVRLTRLRKQLKDYLEERGNFL